MKGNAWPIALLSLVTAPGDASARDPARQECRVSNGDFTDGVGGVPWGRLPNLEATSGPVEGRVSFFRGCLVVGEARFNAVSWTCDGSSLVEVHAVESDGGTVEGLLQEISKHHGPAERDVRAMTHYRWHDGALEVYLAPSGTLPSGEHRISMLALRIGAAE